MRLGVGSVSIRFVGDEVKVITTCSKGQKGKEVTVGSRMVLESVTSSWGSDGASVRVIEQSLDARALGVKDPELMFQFRASFGDAGDCTVLEDMSL